MAGLTINGTNYDVNIVYSSMNRSFTQVSGSNAGTMLDKSEYPDVIGTAISYTFRVEPNPNNRAAYDSLYEVLSNPVNSVTVSGLPYGQSTITFVGRVISATDVYDGELASQKRWKGLSVTIKSLAPYKTI